MAKISDLLKKLVEIKRKEGDLELVCWGEKHIISYRMNMEVRDKVLTVKKLPSGKKSVGISIAEPWDYTNSAKENLKDGRILTKEKVLKL